MLNCRNCYKMRMNRIGFIKHVVLWITLLSCLEVANSQSCKKLTSKTCISEFAGFTKNLTIESAKVSLEYVKLLVNPLNSLNLLFSVVRPDKNAAIITVIKNTIVQSVKTTAKVLRSKNFEMVSNRMLGGLLRQIGYCLQFINDYRDNRVARKAVNLTTHYVKRCIPIVRSMMASLDKLDFKMKATFMAVRSALWVVDRCSRPCEGADGKCKDPFYCNFAAKTTLKVTEIIADKLEV